jgi:phage-related protein
MSGGNPVPQVAGVDGVAGKTDDSSFGGDALTQSMGTEFSNLMQKQTKEVSKVKNATETAGASQSSQATGSVYQKMLAPLQDFRANFDKIVANVGDMVNRGNISMADLMQIQFQFTQLSYMNDLSAKVSDKVSSGVQTLFRNQG